MVINVTTNPIEPIVPIRFPAFRNIIESMIPLTDTCAYADKIFCNWIKVSAQDIVEIVEHCSITILLLMTSDWIKIQIKT